MSDLEYIRGSTINTKATITRDDAVLNITGATFTFKAKKWKSDVTALIEKDNTAFVITNALNGEVVLTLDPEDTEGFTADIVLNCEIEMTETSGRKSKKLYTMSVVRDL